MLNIKIQQQEELAASLQLKLHKLKVITKFSKDFLAFLLYTNLLTSSIIPEETLETKIII